MNPRLKALELHGYKTFASKNDFEFPGNITAIVGPNGSGKSNISDALRWVLGEQSYSLLRGRKTEDMIFSGSDQRPRAGMASATITFDNSDGWLPIDFSEVSITRRAYRDGGNEYLLNGQRVRLKDISELLAQSGLAERTYTIIGQGQVDAALSLRPEERRQFFEEAAGIGLYRIRREESLNRLDSTQRNLERAQDIVNELGPRLASLERQAKKAEEYERLRADLNVLLKDWYGYHWHNTQRELARAREILKNQEEKVKTARSRVEEVESKVEEARQRLQSLRTELNEWHSLSAGLHNDREKINRELAVLDERQRSIIDQRKQLDRDLVHSEEEDTSNTDRLENLLQEKTRLQQELDEAAAQLKTAQAGLEERQKLRNDAESKVREARKILVNLETQQVQLKAHQRELTARLDSLAASGKTLQSSLENADADLEKVKRDFENASKAQAAAEEKLSESEAALQKHVESTRDFEEQAKTLASEKSRAEANLLKAKAQLDILIQAEKSMAGLAEGARNLLQAASQGKLQGNYSALSSLLMIPAEYEKAIAAVLGDQLDAIWLDDITDPDLALDYLAREDKGRAVLMPARWMKKTSRIKESADADCLGIAADLVQPKGQMQKLAELLLGQVLIVKDRTAARRVSQDLQDSAKVVTLNGEVFSGSGIVIAGHEGRSAIVSRPRQKKEIEDQLGELEDRVNDLDQQEYTVNQKLSGARETQKSLENLVKTCRSELTQRHAAYQAASLAMEQVKQKQEWQKNQLTSLNDQIGKASREFQDLSGKLDSGVNTITETNQKLRDLNQKVAELPLDELQADVVHWNTNLAVSTRAVKEAARRYEEYLGIVNSSRENRQRLSERINTQDEALTTLVTDKDRLHRLELELNEKIEQLQVKIDPAEHELITLDEEYSRLQTDYSTLRQSEANADRTNTQAQLELSRIRESLDNLRRRIEEDFGLVALEYSENVTGPTPLPLEGVDSLPVVNEITPELEEAINRQRAQLKRMGAVNPEAKREFDELKERYTFLTGQITDLRKADADLHQIIDELNDLMRKEFKTTFTAVAAEFKIMFTRMFGGGSARLIMTDDEDPTETGIDIEAKLPGRREQGLSLLSGGERSLTAVALIFSLLKVSPTPFCVMDEVDAALDEANVGRFTELLKELSLETQFIVITHNRNTVQSANVIYGVTMGRDSASQVISLRLDEVNEEMAK
ncbi:MAG: chromosome segregation protein SMC [Anaerolineaceae bacterium]